MPGEKRGACNTGTGRTKRTAGERNVKMKFDWLKEIIGEGYTEEIDGKVSKQIGDRFVAKADFDATNTAYKTLETQLAERDKQLEELKKIDADGLQAQIDTLQKENKAAKDEHEKQINSIKLDNALELALVNGKAKSTKAVRAMLDMEKIKLDGDNLLGIEDQLKALRESDGYLFDDADPDQTKSKVKSGNQHGDPLDPKIDEITAAAREGAGLPPLKE